MSAGDELVEWIAADGTVIEIVTRARMRDEHLRHRCVYIVVRSAGAHGDAVLIHKRADWKDIAPGAWDVAFGGVCDPGESWEESAHRELFEEAGVEGAELIDHGEVSFEAPGVSLLGRLYSCFYDGPFSFNDGEVVDTEWIMRSDVAETFRERNVPDDSGSVVIPRILDWLPASDTADQVDRRVAIDALTPEADHDGDGKQDS